MLAVWGELYVGSIALVGVGCWDRYLVDWRVQGIPENDRHIITTCRHPLAVGGVDDGIRGEIVSEGGI